MQVAAGVIREHEKPMSWPRAMLIAVGFFFVTAIFLGQIPSYVYTVATLSTLQRLEQGFLSLGLLSLGIGLLQGWRRKGRSDWRCSRSHERSRIDRLWPSPSMRL